MRNPAHTSARAVALLEERLHLVEFLLGCDDLASCAQRSLEWLSRCGGVPQAILLAVDEFPRRMVGVAGVGLSAARVLGYELDLEQRAHPLVACVTSGQPRLIAPGEVDTPFAAGPLWAVPVGSSSTGGHGASAGARLSSAAHGSDDARHPVALILAREESAQASSELIWLSQVLGDRVLRLRAGNVLAERQFQRERSLLYSIINAVTDPILLTDMEGRLIVANARAERLFSAKEDESEGRRRAVALNNMLFSAALASKAMESADPSRNELLLVDPTDGTDLLFEFLASPVRDADGSTGVVSVLRNVTDLGRASQEIGENVRKLRAAQAEVRSERHRLDLIIDSVADPIVVSDAAGDIVLMNVPAERLFTVPHQGSDDAQRRVRSNDAHFSSFVSNLLFSGNDLRWRGEISLVDPLSGNAMPVEAVSGKILSERGELTTVVTILHDRTEALEKAQLYDQLKRASEELEMKVQAATAELAQQNELLRRQAIELEQASAAKSQFLANMSHEFRTPLNAILGYTNMLLQGVSGGLNPGQRKNLTRIDSNGRHLLEVINEILDITRIESGRMPLHVSSFALPELLAEVTAELEPIIARSRLPVTTEVAGKLPVLHSDRQKVKQIVLNLLSNALKFTHQGSIRLRARATAKELAISVTDTGIGIAPADQQKVFEDFQQADNSNTRAYGGTGLGLSICRRLAQMLGGRITLQSALGEGSTFTLHLPRRRKKS